MSLFKCRVCAAHEARIADLKEEIRRLVEDRENERSEYKRAVDALLIKSQSPAIGQGSSRRESGEVFDPTKLLTMFDEEVKEKN